MSKASAARRAEAGPTVNSFDPVVAADCRVLVLGSMPGEVSLASAQYYAHPRNAFWPILGGICGFEPSLPYRERVAALTDAGVGLWDVLAHCRRKGSLDADIDRASEVANPLPRLLRRLRKLRAVAFNGGTALRTFGRHVRPRLPATLEQRLAWVALPSTSPANASLSPAQKRERWSLLAAFLDG